MYVLVCRCMVYPYSTHTCFILYACPPIHLFIYTLYNKSKWPINALLYLKCGFVQEVGICVAL